MIPLRVNDVKQWNYCPRIVFYNTVLPVSPPPTFKMEHGTAQEDLFSTLETRRVLTKYGLSGGERFFRVLLEAPELRLTGKLDMLIKSGAEYYPVDFKYSRQGTFRNHIFQLTAYALLVDGHYKTNTTAGFVYMIPTKGLYWIEIGADRKAEVLEQLVSIRSMVDTQSFPDPTPRRSRCYPCEFLNFCGDVL